MTHKLLDKHTQKIIYIYAVRPITTANLNYRLDIDGGESSTSVPTVSIISRHDDSDPSIITSMPEFDPDDLIGRIFLLAPQENEGSLRAKVTKKFVEEIEGHPNINFILDIGEGKVEE